MHHAEASRKSYFLDEPLQLHPPSFVDMIPALYTSQITNEKKHSSSLKMVPKRHLKTASHGLENSSRSC